MPSKFRCPDWELGGAIGFEFLLGDAMSRELSLPKSIPWKLKLPNFGVRFELGA